MVKGLEVFREHFRNQVVRLADDTCLLWLIALLQDQIIENAPACTYD